MNPKTDCCVVIPVYNNAATVRGVILRSLAQIPNVLVVDDGSTDLDLTTLPDEPGLTILRHEKNRGKGAAIRTAIEYLRDKPFVYMLTLDADGQHNPEDIPNFFPYMEADDHSMLIGCRDFDRTEHVPGSSRFGRAFANFWMKIETGLTVGDCQSGFRAYPMRWIPNLRCLCSHYNFETEILVRAAWGNLDFHDVPITVHYPKPGERISHFKPFMDNLRLSLIHAHLTGLRCLPYPKQKLRRKKKSLSIFRPKELFLALLRENATPIGLGASAALGSFLAVLPIPGFHIAAILYASERLHLNKVMSFAIQHLFMPPVSPFLCIELGYYLHKGKFLTTLTFETVVREMPLRLWEWFLGSLILAPFWSIVCGVLVWAAAALFQRRKKTS